MGLSQALFSGISGLTTHQRAMDNIGNNLANVNTVSFKKGVFQFRTLLEQSLRGGTAKTDSRGAINPVMIGLGTQTGSINKDYNQGSVQVTGNQRDLMIEGNGYFVLRQQNNNVYTRDGTFYLGSDGSLLGGQGLAVQGIPAENGVVPEGGLVTDLQIPIGKTGAARETTQVSFSGNLKSDVEVASGLRLVGTDPTINPFPAEVQGFVGTTNLDTSWTAINGVQDAFINGGAVITSVPLAQPDGGGGYQAATMDTDLRDVYYQGAEDTWIQPFKGIQPGDEVTMSFRKGGRRYEATFTYDLDTTVPYPPAATDPKQSFTVRHFMKFLTGGVDEPANMSSIANATGAGVAGATRTIGGVMGTVKTAGKISAEHTGGIDPYDVPVETAGAYSRSVGTVDYNSTGVQAAAFNTSIVSNLGEENAISDLEIQFNNINFTDIFKPDLQYSAPQGGSATTNIMAFDSRGNPKSANIKMSLVSQDSNFSTWRWIADSQDDTDAGYSLDPNGVQIDTNANVGTGLIRFDSSGNFVSGVELSETGGIEFTLEDQGVNFPLSINLREGLSSDQTQDLDFSFLTSVATNESDFNLREQDGTAPGTLNSFTVTTDGEIQGVFSNGVVETLGRISLALIPNEAGLIPAGNNLFLEGPSSGAGQVAFANIGGRGAIRAGALEGSNVDLSEEFTRLITTERGFQANARVISTSDEMLVELVNLKR